MVVLEMSEVSINRQTLKCPKYQDQNLKGHSLHISMHDEVASGIVPCRYEHGVTLRDSDGDEGGGVFLDVGLGVLS